MRKIVFALATILALFLVMGQIVQFGNFAIANWIPAPAIEIKSPLPNFETVYQNGTIELKIEVRVLMNAPEIISISYSLDGNDNSTLTNLTRSNETHFSPGIGRAYSTELTLNLSNGKHTLRAYSLDSEGRAMSTAVTFTVDTTFRYPTITIISPLNQSYSTNEIPLTYTIDAKVLWSYYTLDYFDDKTFSDNITLTELSDGPHKIKVSALTEWDHYVNQTIYFNVDTSQTDNPSTINSPTTATVMVIIAAAIVIVSAIILYWRIKVKSIT